MSKFKSGAYIIAAVCAGATALTAFFSGGLYAALFPAAIFWLAVGHLIED